ncbi:hypothetical protein [Emticicia sp. TH156]|uniref:hypothetical protein n=1 Tax=Emticicia sp. TH156 TaxID=2067454 RepID=UPI000C7812FF|nr:hypothetical protein [Emticicia sp. TH156]PLK46001.1 hypothetical protein C0V77_01230 [Emticicia sp. TH156]
MTASSALITLFKTLSRQEQRKVAKWIKEHESKLLDSEEDERKEYVQLSNQGLNQAFGVNEPEYTLEDCIEINPDFNNETR